MQTKVKEFIDTYNLKCDSQIRYIDLISEVGELGKELIKGCNYGNKNYTNTSDLESEIGDCIFSLIALSTELDINIENALNITLKKYIHRFEQKGTISSE